MTDRPWFRSHPTLLTPANGLGGITVQGSASNVQVKQENNGNVYLSMSVQGIFISATVNLVLYSGTNNAMVYRRPELLR